MGAYIIREVIGTLASLILTHKVSLLTFKNNRDLALERTKTPAQSIPLCGKYTQKYCYSVNAFIVYLHFSS